MLSSSHSHAELPVGLWCYPWMTKHFLPLQDKKVTEILTTAGDVITLTIIPTVIYEHMIKR